MLSGVLAIGRQITDSPRRARYGNATNAVCFVVALTNVPGATANVLHDDCEHRLGPFQTRNIDNDGPRKRPNQSNVSPPIIAYLNCPLRRPNSNGFPPVHRLALTTDATCVSHQSPAASTRHMPSGSGTKNAPNAASATGELIWLNVVISNAKG